MSSGNRVTAKAANKAGQNPSKPSQNASKVRSEHDKPQGREEVVVALLDAARKLFGERGANAVSVRDVSAAAGVNHALMHRHFGSKTDLLMTLLANDATAFRTAISQGDEPSTAFTKLFDVLRQYPSFWRVLAHILAEGQSGEELVEHKGGMSQLARLACEHAPGRAEREVMLDVALSAAMGYGWLLYGPFIMRVLGQSFPPEDVVARQHDIVSWLLDSAR
jgi:AcrR family transcriptional regulator